MLIAEPTKYGAGVTIYGDYWDLRDLHQTIHYLCESRSLGPHLSEFVLGLAYEIRHAYQKDRKEKAFGHDEYDQVKYRGVDILWPIILVQAGLLRWSAGFVPTNKKHQANLYKLESCLNESLNLFDPETGQYCMDWLSRFSGFSSNYILSFVSHSTKKFICEGKTGKARFKKLPSVLESFYPFSKEYRKFEEAIKKFANDKKCDPNDLQDWSELPEFRW